MPGRVVVIGNAGLDLRLAVPRLPQPGETLIGSDAFCAVMAAALARGFALDRAIAAAQKAAALTATRPGAFVALPSRAELQALRSG